MSALAEASLDPPGAGTWLKRIAIALTLVALVAALVWGLRGLMSSSGKAPQRQVAKLTLLPDTPPPPPPPPKEEPKPKPVEASKPQPMEQAKPAEAPRAEPLKMEGAAGDGPSAFAAGAVSRDYIKGDPAAIAASGGGPGIDRAQERFYANSARQLLRDEIERQLKGDAAQLTAVFSLWVAADGAIQRFELTPSGRDDNDAELRSALEHTRQALKLPPPPALQQPMRFRLTLRPLG